MISTNMVKIIDNNQSDKPSRISHQNTQNKFRFSLAIKNIKWFANYRHYASVWQSSLNEVQLPVMPV